MAAHNDGRQNNGRRADDLGSVLRSAVEHENFDYEALVAGAHHRAGRIRRRRAIVTGATVAVLGPALVGGAALVLPDILPGGEDATVVAPASRPDDVALTSSPDTVGVTAEPTPDAPPWQDESLPEVEGGFDVNEDIPNAWEIPDARPTGIEVLDGLGAPQLAMNYPRVVPVQSLMTCDPGREGGVRPEAGQLFDFYSDDPDDPTVYLNVTGWDDSSAARDGLATDGYTLCTWDDFVEPQEWSGHEGDEDYLLFAPEGNVSAAVVRQGDYLVSVTVRGSGEATDVELAAEVASRTADNIEALDPVHGRD